MLYEVITVMPGMGGRELAQHLSMIKPDLRILFMSGYTDDLGILSGHRQETTRFLQKPFTPDVLAETIRQLLDVGQAHEKNSQERKTSKTAPAQY